MKEPHDPNVTADDPSATAVSAGAADTPRTTDDVRGPAGPAGPHPSVDAPANDLPAVPGYRVLREIARGGMGRVLGAYDLALDREVALKVLLPGADADRFVRESKITARLPHPGIPPVHALGALENGSPFLAMKLVAGRTLADEMKSADRPRLLQAFLQVCQAVGFAHSRGIIHRDLKPANVMVGAFGEVQVMDWGLAKDTTGREAVDEAQSARPRPTHAGGAGPGATADHGAAGGSTDERTRAGTVLGTPPYMAPEQARGEATDARADVFALGGILCAILTGQPPFTGKSTLEVVRRAGAADLAEAHARLDGCRAEADLVALCRRCLSPSPADRPADAQAVADGMTAYLAGAQEKLRKAELAEAEAKAKTREEAKRRRLALALAGVVLVVLLVGLGGTTWGLILAKRQEGIANQNADLANKQEGIAKQNADAAIEVVRDLSSYVEYYEMGSGTSAVSDEERKQRLDAALASYDRLLELHPDDKTVRWHIARMHRFRANLSRYLDQTEHADKSYQTSLKLFRGLVADFPEELKYRELDALVKRDYAGQLEKLGRYKEASHLLDESIELYEGLLRGQPNVPNFQRNLAHMVLIRSDLDFQVGRLADSERSARRSAELYAKVAKVPGTQQPLDPLFHAMAELNLAVALREQGRLKEADSAHKSAVERMMGLIRAHSTRDTLSFYSEVRAQRAVTQARITPDSLVGPIADLRGAIQGWDRLINQMGPSPVDLNRKAVSSLYSGRLKVQAGQRGEAVKDLLTAATILEELVKKQPEIPRYRYDLGRTYTTLGQVTDDAQQADDWYRKAREMLDGALTRYPENAHYRQALTELKALAPTQS
jgi:serine/threonine protein kinase/tetratricopeptide (TPR) repeat protein